MKDSNLNSYTIGEIVAQDYRAAAIFKEAGIDFSKQEIDDFLGGTAIRLLGLKK